MVHDVILGMAAGYDIKTLQPFLRSLIESEYKGRIVFFVNSIDNETTTYLRQHSIELCFFGQGDIPLASQRFFLYKQFIEQDPRISQIMITDVRDVIFQCNPFTVCNDDKLYCFEEDRSMTLSTCPYNSQWIYHTYGKNALNTIGHNPIICAGVTIGSYKNIRYYIETLCKELVKSPPILGVDQGIHNFLIRSGLIPNTLIYDNKYSPVYNLHYVKAKNIEIGEKGFIVNGFGIPCVVHQYDRHPTLLMETQRRYVTFHNSLGSSSEIVKVKIGDIVQVDFAATLDDGSKVVSSFNQPLVFIVGKNQISREFDQAVLGMSPGEWKSVKVMSDQVFGTYREELVFVVSRDILPLDCKQIEVGQQIVVQRGGKTFQCTVINTSESFLTLDANYPLSTKGLNLYIQLVKIIQSY